MGQAKLKKAPGDIHIAQFLVLFQSIYAEVEVAGEIDGRIRVNASASVTLALNRVAEADLQGITDTLYQRYVDQPRRERGSSRHHVAAVATKAFAGALIEGLGVEESEHGGKYGLVHVVDVRAVAGLRELVGVQREDRWHLVIGALRIFAVARVARDIRPGVGVLSYKLLFHRGQDD
ncbi:MAG: hypothetical protein ACI9MC_003765 [Kiritimatiellia bacterium]